MGVGIAGNEETTERDLARPQRAAATCAIFDKSLAVGEVFGYGFRITQYCDRTANRNRSDEQDRNIHP